MSGHHIDDGRGPNRDGYCGQRDLDGTFYGRRGDP